MPTKKINKSSRNTRNLRSGTAKSSRKPSRKPSRNLRSGAAKSSRKPSFRFRSSRLFTIFTQDGCGACGRAKDMLDKRGIQYNSYVRNDYEELVTKLTNNYDYVPVIFDGDKFIGGYNDLEKYLNLNNL